MPIRPGRSRNAVVAAVAAALVMLPAGATAETFRVRAAGEPGDFKWMPRTRTIGRGDRIVWKNPTGTTHTVTAYSNNWGKDAILQPGERTRKKFRRRGTYKFRCTIGEGTAAAHSSLDGNQCSGMCGKIKVE